MKLIFLDYSEYKSDIKSSKIQENEASSDRWVYDMWLQSYVVCALKDKKLI